MIQLTGTRIIEAGIEGLSRGDNLGGMMRVLNLLQFVPLDQKALVRSTKLYPGIRTWWGESLTSISAKYCFKHKDNNIMWSPPLNAAETALELLFEKRLQQQYKSHLIPVTWKMYFLWRKQMWKEADLLFNFPVMIPFGGLGEHEPLIIALFLPNVSCRNWNGPWTIRGSYWGGQAVMDV